MTYIVFVLLPNKLKGSVCKKIKGGRGLREKIYMVIATNLISICSVYKDKIVKYDSN